MTNLEEKDKDGVYRLGGRDIRFGGDSSPIIVQSSRLPSEGKDDKGGGDIVVASSGARSRNRSFFSGKHVRVLPSGIRLENFKKNPVLLLRHGFGDLPIGTADVFMDDGKLKSRLSFHGLTDTSRQVESLWNAKVLNAVSIHVIRDVDDDKNMVETADEIIVPTSELVELSVVVVGADADAVRQHLQGVSDQFNSIFLDKSEGSMDEQDGRELSEEEETPTQSENTAAEEDTIFSLDEVAINQLSEGLGIDALLQRIEQLEGANAQQAERIADLEGEYTTTQRVSSHGRVRFNLPQQQQQEAGLPQGINLPRKVKPASPKSRSAQRMMRRSGGA